ncbi:hypothetical protein MUB13_20905 [Pseudomonas aeruginosa]|uniref:hypothetical protein n=1 Tax=Pseudomonas aeruginosa TaxID=287 RepID=UPI000B355B33|nr:hypothetical protein [Pseudomonas aeruginosa]MBK1563780.1 hypothetical protein [Pseudomonas aeruginosa]MCJ1951306.1 hypothetical protein [Pseudomonas aeruginosa]OUM37329.1 hypothetical protein B8W76_05860 [Pseudomonas aeruginosa]PBL99821.1 hypothetical protein B8B58_34275 [Pseudomonas aeruginosa]PBM03221.1 hypothetical protein B8B88_33040 [Pseudomonas aeruginosa]
MSKQSHTPGPWEIERYSDGLIQIVGNIRAVSDHEEHVTTVVEAVTRGDEANARLIAAAPELLSIAKRWAALDGSAWHLVRYEEEKRELLAATNEAIAKATA